MITATLDDGMGHGLAIIERFATVLGMTVEKMGLLQEPEAIVTRCRTKIPDFLGLTVLQLDSDDDLARVSQGIPKKTCLIAGGAAFRHDPELADRCRVGFVAKNVAFFIDFILRWSPSGR
jgi:methylmalonyl-CoA mutase cobalamin-binding subunit